MKLGTPKDYAYLYRASFTDEYKRRLLIWLDEQRPGLRALVEKELARDKATKGKESKRMEVDRGTKGIPADENEISPVGGDLLAGGS